MAGEIPTEFRKELFKRSYQITVSTESSIGAGFAQALVITDEDSAIAELGEGALDFDFDITKDLTGEPNKCRLTIYNLSEDDRNKLDSLSIFDPKRPKGQKLPRGNVQKQNRAPKTGRIRVEIEAGYAETHRALIFRGDVRRAISEQDDDKSWSTSIEGEDGGMTVLASRITESFPKGSNYRTIVERCAQALGLGLGNIAEVDHLLERAISKGWALDGPAARELAGVAKAAKVGYSIQDGSLFWRALDGSTGRTAIAVDLNWSTGLVGSPKRLSTGLIEAVSLLNPDLAVGGYVNLGSKNISGSFYIQKITYNGSNFGDEWYATLELKGY